MTVNNQYLYSDITDKVIKAAANVHKTLGPGLVEKLYQRALKIELTSLGVTAEREKQIYMQYQGRNIGFDKVDFDIEGKVLVELKAVTELNKIHQAQMLSYLKSSGRRVGLLLNFANLKLEIKRVIV